MSKRDPLIIKESWGVGHVADTGAPNPLSHEEQEQISNDLDTAFDFTSFGGM